MPRFVASLPDCQLEGSGTHTTNLPKPHALCARLPQRVREDSEVAFAFLKRHCAQLNFNIQTSSEMGAAFGATWSKKKKKGSSAYPCWFFFIAQPQAVA